MSKNIDEIAEQFMPDSFASGSDSYNAGFFGGKELLKQALTEKKLVLPLSVEQLTDLILNLRIEHKTCYESAKAIYEAQFKGDEK